MAFEELFDEDDEHLSSNGAVCPYCGYVHEAGADNPSLYDESTEEFKCEHCNKKFKVRVDITFDWWTSKREDVDND